MREEKLFFSMEDLSLHILDVAENAVRAKAKKITVRIIEEKVKDTLTLIVEDDGIGMDKETAERALDPFFTTKGGKKVGLGLSLLSHAAQQAGGWMKVTAKESAGTKVTAVFKLSHPDLKPLGDIGQTMAVLIAGNPSIRFICDCKVEGQDYYFDSGKLR